MERAGGRGNIGRGSSARPRPQPNGQQQQWRPPHGQANIVQHYSTAFVAHPVAPLETITPDYNGIDQFNTSHDQFDYAYSYG